MKMLTLIYIVNASLLLLHEIESAYEKEWEILKLPGRITGFLLMHIPILLLLFYGAVEIDKGSGIGYLLGIITGFSGLIPFIVHKLIVKRAEHFNLFISNFIIYFNILTGVVLLVLTFRML